MDEPDRKHEHVGLSSQLMDSSAEEGWIRRLLDVGRELVTELDLSVVLDRVLQTAREVTGARYAALGILNEQRTELEQFLTAGVDEETKRSIGDLPRGRGVLGALIENQQPLRLADVGRHPSSYGFPAGHPVMRSFLGVPVRVRGQAWGNLYLTEKEGGEFTERDEEAAVILADWAAVAIDNARLYETSERRRREAERAIRGLEATRDVAVAIGGEIALEHVLELIVKRGRALIGARSLVIMLRDGHELVVQASAGHVQATHGARLPIAESTSGQVLERGHPERIVDVSARLRIAPMEFGVADPQTALLVPMVYRGDGVGILAAFDRGEEGSVFSAEDEQMMRTFAASAATAVALAQSVQSDRLRSSLAAADAERRHWARELHDETLQGLGGLRVLLSSARRGGDLERAQAAMGEAVEHIEREIDEPALDHHRAAAGRAGRTGAEHRDRSAAGSPPRAERLRDRRGVGAVELLEGGAAPERRPGDDRVSPRAGGAHEHRQACSRKPGSGGGRRVRGPAADRGAGRRDWLRLRRHERWLRPGGNA